MFDRNLGIPFWGSFQTFIFIGLGLGLGLVLVVLVLVLVLTSKSTQTKGYTCFRISHAFGKCEIFFITSEKHSVK